MVAVLPQLAKENKSRSRRRSRWRIRSSAVSQAKAVERGRAGPAEKVKAGADDKR